MRLNLIGYFLVVAAAPVVAAPKPAANPAALQKVLDCQALADNTARLACFDASVGQMSAAQSRGDLAMIDRDQVRQTRRKLFGFTLPDLDIFGGGDKEEKVAAVDRVDEVVGKVTAVGRTSDGGFVLTLEDGARWQQTGTMTWGRFPKVGSIATIKRAALGSFKMSVDGSPSVKARRVG